MPQIFDFLKDADNYEERKVDLYEDDDLFVSTAKVSDGASPYETAIGHPLYNDNKLVIVEAYNNRALAQKGHDKWLKTMQAKELPPKLIDCGNAAVSTLLGALGGEMEFPIQKKVQ